MDKLQKIIFSFPIPLTIIAAIFLFMAPMKEFKPEAIFIGVALIIFTSFLRRLYKKRRFKNESEDEKEFDAVKTVKYKHHDDLKSFTDVLNKIKEFIEKNPKNSELKHIYQSLQKEMDHAGEISERLDMINKTLDDPYWDMTGINERIKNEENKSPVDHGRLDRLNEMKEHVIKLKEKKEKLEGSIGDLALSFQTIFTKMTLVDNYDRASFDEIETEIKKILDHQIKVSEYEEKLEKEFYR